MAERLVAETRGNPLLVTHMTDDVHRGSLPIWLYQRDQLLDGDARAVLDQAATFGREFDAEIDYRSGEVRTPQFPLQNLAVSPTTRLGWCEFYQKGRLTNEPGNQSVFENGQLVKNIGYWNLMFDQLGSEGYNYTSDANGYTSNVINWNSADAFNANNEFAPGNQYRTLKHGYSSMFTALFAAIETLAADGLGALRTGSEAQRRARFAELLGDHFAVRQIGDRLIRVGWGASWGVNSAPRLFSRGAKRWGAQPGAASRARRPRAPRRRPADRARSRVRHRRVSSEAPGRLPRRRNPAHGVPR